ncbi:hypothetical protein [Patulibacter sp. SYSU D01012]|uniref:hypothetical protein n=1 Tax=Patulibacter sp. SYSU D01012 TaxID=2817381 RepID=UPI001B3104C0|nr:hypothetical protein [Patulibacter sp. SYSU D01012]
MPGAPATGPRATARRTARLPLLVLLAMLVAELLDVVGAASANGVALADAAGVPAAAPELGGLAVAGALALRVARRERREPCTRWPRRLAETTGILLVGLTAQELFALALHVGHGDGVAELAAHVAGSVLPLALGLGAALAFVVGVVGAVRRGRGRIGAARTPVRPGAPARRPLPAAALLPAGLLLARRHPGRAPPVPAR